jgi:hypothetical protein
MPHPFFLNWHIICHKPWTDAKILMAHVERPIRSEDEFRLWQQGRQRWRGAIEYRLRAQAGWRGFGQDGLIGSPGTRQDRDKSPAGHP